MYKGQKISLDFGSTAPVDVKIISWDDATVIVEYMNSTPGRIETFNIAEFHQLCSEQDFNAKSYFDNHELSQYIDYNFTAEQLPYNIEFDKLIHAAHANCGTLAFLGFCAYMENQIESARYFINEN